MRRRSGGGHPSGARGHRRTWRTPCCSWPPTPRATSRATSWRWTGAGRPSESLPTNRGARMRIIDLHSHWGTRRGYPFQTPEELAQQRRVFRSDPSYVTEDEMAAHFRAAGVRTILDLGVRSVSIAELRDLHDYALDVQRRFPDVVLGNWLH